MFRSWRNAVGLCVCVMSLFIPAIIAEGDEPASKPAGPQPVSSDPCRGGAGGVKFREALNTKLDLDFTETALTDVVLFLQHKFDVPLMLDRRALEAAGVGGDTPITFRAKQVRLQSVLRQLLRGLGLTYLVRNDIVYITTLEEVESSLSNGIYNIRDLIAAAKHSKYAADDEGVITDSLVQMIRTTTGLPKPGWVEDGGVGAILAYDGQLIVSQTCGVHDQIEQLLAACRKLVKLQAEKPGELLTEPLGVGETIDAIRVRKTLNQIIPQVAFHETQLKDAVELFNVWIGIPFFLDHRALESAGVGSDTPVTLHCENWTMNAILNHVIHDFGLTWVIQDDVVVITTLEEAEAQLKLRLYPARDLLNVPWERYDDTETRLAALIQSITGRPKPGWVSDGGVGFLHPLPFAEELVVLQTGEVHQQIAELLAEMRRLRSSKPVALPATEKEVPLRIVRAIHPIDTSSPSLAPTEILARVLSSIEPDGWRKPNVTAMIIGRNLVIHHTPNVQRRCVELLMEFQQASGSQTP